MNGQTSIGPDESRPTAGEGRKEDQTIEGVDAHKESEFDIRHGLTVPESKPLSHEPATGSSAQAEQAGKQSDHEAAASEPATDPNQEDPNARSDMISERRNPGAHGGGGDPAWKPS